MPLLVIGLSFVGPSMVLDVLHRNDSFVVTTVPSSVDREDVMTLRSRANPSYSTTPSAHDFLWLRTLCFAACALLLTAHVLGLMPSAKR